MAKQWADGHLEGTMGGVNYYRSQGSYLARRKPGVTKQRWKSEGTFERTREAAMDFGCAVRHAAGLRLALSWLVRGVCSLRSLGRLNARMFRCVRTDVVHRPGERELNMETLADCLVGYEFNDRQEVGAMFLGTWKTAWKESDGIYKIIIERFDSGMDLVVPAGSTHFSFCGGVVWWTGERYRWSGVLAEGNIKAVGVGKVEGMVLVMEGVELPVGSRAVAVFGVRWFVEEGEAYRMVRGGAANGLRVVEVFF